jgi:hypothetical protein
VDLQGSEDVGLMLVIFESANDEAVFVVLEIYPWIVIEDNVGFVDFSSSNDNLLDIFYL